MYYIYLTTENPNEISDVQSRSFYAAVFTNVTFQAVAMQEGIYYVAVSAVNKYGESEISGWYEIEIAFPPQTYWFMNGYNPIIIGSSIGCVLLVGSVFVAKRR